MTFPLVVGRHVETVDQFIQILGKTKRDALDDFTGSYALGNHAQWQTRQGLHAWKHVRAAIGGLLSPPGHVTTSVRNTHGACVLELCAMREHKAKRESLVRTARAEELFSLDTAEEG